MILGLTGRMGAGKDTVYQRLNELYPRVVQVSYAAKLKESVAALFGISREDIEGWKNDPEIRVQINKEWRSGVEMRYEHEEHGVTVLANQTFREFLQRYGTEAHREVFGPNFWLDAALPLDNRYRHDTIYAVTDVRFENEVERVQALGGQIVKVIGSLDDTPFKHQSENVPEHYDFLIDNVIRDDNFEALDFQVHRLVHHLEMVALGRILGGE